MSAINNESQERVLLYPATGVHAGMTDIMYSVGDYIRKAFPQNFFKSYHYNTKDGFYSQYFRIKDSRLKGQNLEFTQQKKPRLVILYEDRNNDVKSSGLGADSPFKFPMSQGIHPEFHEYEYFFRDDNGIVLYTNDKRIRVNLEIIVEVNSASDQEDVLAYLENTIKVQYGMKLQGVRAKFILPNHLMNFLRNLLYYNNIISASSTENEVQQKELFDEINKSFNEYLTIHSGKGIIRGIKKNIKGEENFYLLDRIYRKMYLQAESPPEKTDGDKKGEVYDKFTTNFTCFFEVYKPFTYILRTPDVVCGHLVDDIVRVSQERDKLFNYMPTGFIPYQRKPYRVPNKVQTFLNMGFKLLYKETEFMVDSPKDYIDILDWLADPKLQNKYKDYIAYIKTLTNEDFDQKFKFFVYSDITLKDAEDVMYDKGILYLTNNNSTRLHTLYLLYDHKDVDYKMTLFKAKE